MTRVRISVACLGLLFAGSVGGCGDDTSKSGGHGGWGGEGGSGKDCQSIESTCQLLDELECGRHEGCSAVKGAPWLGSIEASAAQEREFLACRAGCLESPDVQTCIYDPSDPQRCYYVPEASVPSGWEELFECEIPEEFCGS